MLMVDPDYSNVSQYTALSLFTKAILVLAGRNMFSNPSRQ